jgi:hypothetical protein
MLAISIRGLRENDRWRTLRDERRRPFPTWEDFCQHPEPWGLELSPEQVEAILERSNAGKRLSAVLGEHGGDRGNQHTGGKRQASNSKLGIKHGNNRPYVCARLRREGDEATAAAIEAGTASANSVALARGWAKKRELDPSRSSSAGGAGPATWTVPSSRISSTPGTGNGREPPAIGPRA